MHFFFLYVKAQAHMCIKLEEPKPSLFKNNKPEVSSVSPSAEGLFFSKDLHKAANS